MPPVCAGLLISTACLQTQRVKSCSRRRPVVWARKRVESRETPTFAWRSGDTCQVKCETGIAHAIQPMNPRTAEELRTRRNGLTLVHFEIGKQQRTVTAARYAAPAGVLIDNHHNYTLDLEHNYTLSTTTLWEGIL